MPQIGANNEPLLERAIFGYDGTNYRVVKVDTDGNLVAAIKASQTIEVIQDTAADLKATVNLAADQNVQARNYGFLGAAWQKLQLLWGYTDRWAERVSTTAAVAGQNELLSAAVPAGYVYVVQAVSLVNLNNAVTSAVISITTGSAYPVLTEAAPVAAGIFTKWTGAATLAAGDKVYSRLQGCTLDDDLYLDILGYKMKIND